MTLTDFHILRVTTFAELEAACAAFKAALRRETNELKRSFK